MNRTGEEGITMTLRYVDVVMEDWGEDGDVFCWRLVGGTVMVAFFQFCSVNAAEHVIY